MSNSKKQTLRVIKETYSNSDEIKTLDAPNGVTYVFCVKLDFVNNRRLRNKFRVGPRGGCKVEVQEFSQYK